MPDSTDLMHRCQSEVRAHEKRLVKLRDEIARLTAEHEGNSSAKCNADLTPLESALVAVRDAEAVEQIQILKARAKSTMEIAKIWAAASVKALEAWET